MRAILKCLVCGMYFEEGTYHEHKKVVLLMDGNQRVRLSKLMSFLLRHNPEAANLHMDKEGWVNIKELVKGIKEVWINKELYTWVTEEHVKAIALLDPKGRFEVKGDLIRARYGHNKELNIRISYDEDKASLILYHGTSSNYVSSILKDGIKPVRRYYVHLTTTKELACEVGSRHGGKPVFLIIDAECLRKSGHKIFIASKQIRLTDYVPPKCIIDVGKC